MKRLNIDYNITTDHFKKIRNVLTDLIYGDLDYIREPWFTYIVPVYKKPELLKRTLESIRNQKPVDFSWDIVVVDNELEEGNPTECMIRKMDEKRILYYRNRENIGSGGNYNRCIETARGKWVAMVHSDDLIMNDHLQLMGDYIRKYGRGIRKLAYISPRYQDFSNENEVKLDRNSADWMDIWYFGHLKRWTYLDVMMTGNSVGIPSFGTVMNREIMLKNGGFQDDLGICEDVITPYKLSKKYRIYTTPQIMGFYRLEQNTCLGRDAIFAICEGMTDFREYLFEKNFITRLWGKLVRDDFFHDITCYGCYLSGHGAEKLCLSDFDYIYPERKERPRIVKGLSVALRRLYSRYSGCVLFEDKVRYAIKPLLSQIKKHGYRKIILYGAGKVGEEAAKSIRKDKNLELLCFAVTRQHGDEKQIQGIPVRAISELTSYRKESFVIISSITEKYCAEMETTLVELGFQHHYTLLNRFHKGRGKGKKDEKRKEMQ